MKYGFSLVELSIVLVILGLLVGGILAGKSLIRASELRAVQTEYQRYATAIHAFRDRYFALPGDMSTATRVWGDQASGAGSCASGATPDGTPGTCNGDGSGAIDQNPERFRSWQQLALAGIIEGSYSGVVGPNTAQDHIFGTNSPAPANIRWGAGGWAIRTIPT